jgi:hypothetical protein
MVAQRPPARPPRATLRPPCVRASPYSLEFMLEFTELEDEISSAKMPDILAHILGQIGANMPVILKYPQIFLTRTKKVKKVAEMPVRKGFQPRS